MSRYHFTAFVLTLLVAASQSIAEDGSAFQWHSDLSAATSEVKEHQRPLIILFTMDNCVYCQKIKASTYQDKVVSGTISRAFVASVVNGPKNPKLAEKFKIKIYPTTVIIAPTGKIVDSISGYIDSTEMSKRLSIADSRVRVAARTK